MTGDRYPHEIAESGLRGRYPDEGRLLEQLADLYARYPMGEAARRMVWPPPLPTPRGDCRPAVRFGAAAALARPYGLRRFLPAREIR